MLIIDFIHKHLLSIYYVQGSPQQGDSEVPQSPGWQFMIHRIARLAQAEEAQRNRAKGVCAQKREQFILGAQVALEMDLEG